MSCTDSTTRRAGNLLIRECYTDSRENQQTIEEFAAGMGDQCAVEHAGAPSDHVNISGAEHDERTTPTPAGNRVLVEADNGRLVVFIDSRRYLLPDVLWAANEMRDRCACAISNLAGNRLTVQLKPHEEGAAPGPLSKELERWLSIAEDGMLIPCLGRSAKNRRPHGTKVPIAAGPKSWAKDPGENRTKDSSQTGGNLVYCSV